MSDRSMVPYTTPRKRTSALAAIDNINEIIPPLDYSFCRFASIADMQDEEPRINSPRKHQVEQVHVEGAKSHSRSLRLNNNTLTNLDSISTMAKDKFEKPSEIAWIDLSFNELKTIDPAILEFENLQILYLHGNQIAEIQEIEKLTSLHSLKKLTLHGNPMEDVKGYRQHILSILPHLNVLDFSCVTKADRRTAETWQKMCMGGKKKKVKKEGE
ncbi:hypothetical protein ScPMuIL_010543 [Solemya velum]